MQTIESSIFMRSPFFVRSVQSSGFADVSLAIDHDGVCALRPRLVGSQRHAGYLERRQGFHSGVRPT
jgi:hypothetical protein